jgi:hypothetical protein
MRGHAGAGLAFVAVRDSEHPKTRPVVKLLQTTAANAQMPAVV